MVDIQSKEVIDKISDELKVQPSLAIPRVVGKDIQLSYNVNPIKKNTILLGGTQSTTRSAFTVFTANSNKRTFLTGVYLWNASNATADNVAIQLTAVIGGATVIIHRMNKITLTAFQDGSFIPFAHPVEIDTGSIVTFTNTFSVGTSQTILSLHGYETDPQ